jgi:hypothetical protein
MTDDYTKLDKLLDSLNKKRGTILFDALNITNQNNIANIKKSFDAHGVIIIKNAASSQSIDNLKNNIADCAIKMFGEGHKKKDQLSWKQNLSNINEIRNPSNGFGNSSFGYFFKQPAAKQDTLTTSISTNKETLYVTQNYGHQVNLNLLLDNVHTTAILLALTHKSGGMVSWDSFKLAENPRPKPSGMTQQSLTACHFDAYGGCIGNDTNNGTERFQAIIAIEEKIKLGYLPDSTNDRIKKLLVSLTGNDNLYKSNGFKSFNDQKIIEIFNKYIIAPPSGSLVLWKSGIIHYEAEFENNNMICKYVSSKNISNQLRIRCVVGIHKPLNLNQAELEELARLSEHGIIPEVYGHINKNTKVYPNIMSSKTTQYKVNRIIGKKEKTNMEKIIKNRNEYTLNNASRLKKYLYGLDQNISNLGLSDADQSLIQTD